jgi:hypothetical protein
MRERRSARRHGFAWPGRTHEVMGAERQSKFPGDLADPREGIGVEMLWTLMPVAPRGSGLGDGAIEPVELGEMAEQGTRTERTRRRDVISAIAAHPEGRGRPGE